MKRVFVIVLFLCVFVLIVSSCGQNCITGKLIEKQSDENGYYFIVAEYSSPFIFSDDLVEVEVDKGFFIKVNIDDVITVCQ